MKYAWNGKNKIFQSSLCLLFLLSFGGCDDSPEKPGEGFYTCPGYRDWYRVPLKFPYQLTMIDDLKLAAIEKYDASKLLVDSGALTWLVRYTTHIIDARDFVAFRRNTKIEGGEPWGFLIYASEKLQYFKTEKELFTSLKQNFSTGIPQWESTAQYYTRKWNELDRQRLRQKSAASEKAAQSRNSHWKSKLKTWLKTMLAFPIRLGRWIFR